RRHRGVHAGRPGAWRRAPGTLRLARPQAAGNSGAADIAGGAEAMSALAVNALSKSFGGLHVTANVNLAVAPGERRLIIAPHSAAKPPCFICISGDIPPYSGSSLLSARAAPRVASRNRAHLGLARTYQIITLFARDTLLRNVMLALLGLSPLRWNPLIAM